MKRTEANSLISIISRSIALGQSTDLLVCSIFLTAKRGANYQLQNQWGIKVAQQLEGERNSNNNQSNYNVLKDTWFIEGLLFR